MTMNHSICTIIGAGVAGISAATWLSSFGVPFRWFDCGACGGILRQVHNAIENFPPEHYGNGRELIDALGHHMRTLALSEPENYEIRSLKLMADSPSTLYFDTGTTFRTDAIILATGTRYRMLNVPGEKEGLGRWVSQSATADAIRVAGANVAVVGGGDAAFENALKLAEVGCKVTMLCRNQQFSARQSFVVAAKQHPAITFAEIPAEVVRIEPRANGCELHVMVHGVLEKHSVACVFVRIGVEPRIPEITPQIDTHDGFVVVDSRQRTSHPSLLAAGDITSEHLRSVATAMGAGANAARTAAEMLGYLRA